MDVESMCLIGVAGSAAFVSLYSFADGGAMELVRMRGAVHGLLRSVRAGSLLAVGRGMSKKERREAVVREMPTFLDIVTLGLSAGLSFDASLELYCKRYRTELAEMLSSALQSWRLGVSSRSQALDEMAQKAKVPALSRFAATVSEALAFGSPLAQTLERQAQVIREEQRSMMEQEVEKVPVKMLIPLGTLIVPAMLLAILGPLLGPALGAT